MMEKGRLGVGRGFKGSSIRKMGRASEVKVSGIGNGGRGGRRRRF